MEPSGRNRWQAVANGTASKKRLKQAKTVAAGCDRLPESGKEGVDGSSPSEGLRLLPAQRPFSLFPSAAEARVSVHRASTNVHRGCVEVVEQPDRVLASVAGEVAVVTIDHRKAGAHSGKARRWRGRHGGQRSRRCAGDRRCGGRARYRLRSGRASSFGFGSCADRDSRHVRLGRAGREDHPAVAGRAREPGGARLGMLTSVFGEVSLPLL